MKNILFYILLLGLTFNVFAEKEPLNLPDTNIATVVAMRGDDNILLIGDKQEKLHMNSKIYVGDTIITDSGFLILQFSDNTRITVRPFSKLIIEDYLHTGSEYNDEMKISLLAGGLRVVTGAIAKQNPESVRLKTPVALMGVRGTEFALMLCDGKICEAEVK